MIRYQIAAVFRGLTTIFQLAKRSTSYRAVDPVTLHRNVCAQTNLT